MSPEVASLLGGSALLIYSIEELSKTVQYIAGSRFRVWINTFAENRFSGILLGIVLSLVLSSSGAVTVMLVGLANARLLSLEQVFSVTLGASIGSTFIVHLFTFNLSEWGLTLVAAAVAVEWLSSEERVSRSARGVLYLGLMFFSMGLVVQAGKQLEQNELFRYTISYFRARPLVSLIIATVLTAIIHSSAATIVFVMSLMVSSGGTLVEALPWVLGANLGTTTTAYLASLRSGPLGKQAALGNFLCKVVGCVICMPLLPQIADLIARLGGDVSWEIALSHTLFNVGLAVLFFPFIGLGVSVARRLVSTHESGGPFVFQYLDPRTLSAPELALAQAQREILRLSDTVEQMVEKSIHLFQHGSEREIEALKGMDAVVDFLNRGIKLYLTKLSQKEMAPEQVQKEFELLLRTNDLENIGDIIDKNIVDLVRKNLRKGYVFSEEGWGEITAFHSKVVELLRLSTAYFNSRDRALGTKLKLLHQQIEDFSLDLAEQHMQRLHRGVKATIDTTSVHLDVLGNLQRIAALAVNFMRIHDPRSEVGLR